ELPPVTVVGFNDKLATPIGGTPPVVLVKTSINGAPAPPSTKAMSGLASAFQSPARIMMPPLLGGGTRQRVGDWKVPSPLPLRICSKPFVPSPIVRAMSRKPSRL